MFNKIVQYDSKLLSIFDSIILYIWDKFEVPKYMIIRIYFFYPLIFLTVNFDILVMINCLISLFFQFSIEYCFHKNKTIYYAYELIFRNMIYYRISFFLISVYSYIMIFIFSKNGFYNYIFSIYILLWGTTYYILGATTPRNPPNKDRFKKLKLKENLI